MTRCITEYLLHEHQELTHLLNNLSRQLQSLPVSRNATQSLEGLEKCCRQVSRALHAHLDEEQQVLYPALEERIEGISTTLDRMRLALNEGEAAEKTLFECLGRFTKGGKSREEIMHAGRSYIQWIRGHLMNENGRLLPLVERRLDAATQVHIRNAMEELAHMTTARVAESFPRGEES